MFIRLTSAALALSLLGTASSSQQVTFEDVGEQSPEPVHFTRSLPDFRAIDSLGHLWTLESLRGKVTLVDLWSIDCPPCIIELPEIERFYQEISRSTSIRVLTFNLDDDPARLAAFLKRKQFTSPVIQNSELAKHLFPLTDGGIPQQWIVNRQAIVRSRFGGPALAA